MLRSVIRLAFRQSAPASRFLGNVERCSPASSITARRNYFNNHYDFVKADFTDWNSMGILFGSIGFAGGMFFYHNMRQSRYNKVPYEKKSTYDTGHYGEEKAEEKELSGPSMPN